MNKGKGRVALEVLGRGGGRGGGGVAVVVVGALSQDSSNEIKTVSSARV